MASKLSSGIVSFEKPLQYLYNKQLTIIHYIRNFRSAVVSEIVINHVPYTSFVCKEWNKLIMEKIHQPS